MFVCKPASFSIVAALALAHGGAAHAKDAGLLRDEGLALAQQAPVADASLADLGWPAPLDAATLGGVSALGLGDIAASPMVGAMVNRIALTSISDASFAAKVFAVSAMLGDDAERTGRHEDRVLVFPQAGQSTMTLAAQDAAGNLAQIAQHAEVELAPRSGETSLGVIMQSAAYDFASASQSAVNVAVGVTFTTAAR